MRYQFVDCRWDLNNRDWGRANYLAAHIPGAAFVDVDSELSDLSLEGRGRHPLPSAARFAEIAGRLGIDASTFVIAYGTMGGPERLWWLLRHYGHDACAVMDLASWRGPMRGGDEVPSPTRFEVRERNDDVIAADELARRAEDLVIVDARTPNRFRGEPNPIDKPPGRVPGAVNSPWNEDPRDLPAGELAVYCGSGITACVILHRSHLLGRDGRLYPGGYSEWTTLGMPTDRE
jgi:thiosulfate/3-mercaptopyruvate sulfurtransferase